MLLHTVDPAELVADARKDWPSIRRKTERPLHQLHRTALRTRSSLATVLDWTSPRGNRWLLRLEAGSRKLVLGMALYRTGSGRLCALYCQQAGLCIQFTAHAIERYGARTDAENDPVLRMSNLFQQLDLPGVAMEPDPHNGTDAVQVSFAHGMGLGRFVAGTEVVAVHTYISKAMLQGDQVTLHKHLEDEAWWHNLTPGQRTYAMNWVKRRQAQDPGTA
jgi:hypothetical protein